MCRLVIILALDVQKTIFTFSFPVTSTFAIFILELLHYSLV